MHTYQNDLQAVDFSIAVWGMICLQTATVGMAVRTPPFQPTRPLAWRPCSVFSGTMVDDGTYNDQLQSFSVPRPRTTHAAESLCLRLTNTYSLLDIPPLHSNQSSGTADPHTHDEAYFRLPVSDKREGCAQSKPMAVGNSTLERRTTTTILSENVHMNLHHFSQTSPRDPRLCFAPPPL